MSKFAVAVGILFALSGGLLISMAPDMLSLVLVIVMCLIIAAGFIFGMVPCLRACDGFRKGRKNVSRIASTSSNDYWLVLRQNETLFGHRQLDLWYAEYMENANRQYEHGNTVSDIETVINEETLSTKYWANVCSQIPGTMTGIGLLGTFLGLILGIANIGFSSVGAALDSVETLLSGIELAFYTSIAGVILSILYNVLHKLTWNITYRELGMFMREFHTGIIPSATEQERNILKKEFDQIIERLDRIPRDGGFLSSGSAGVTGDSSTYVLESVQDAMKNGEICFYLQPRCDLNSREIVGAEALTRWERPGVGTLNPVSFMPVLEKSGYIAKLDQYIWEQVCIWLRKVLDDGNRPLPISINVSGTDVLAFDVPAYLKELTKKYAIPPVCFEIEISESVYEKNGTIVKEMEEELRSAGFRVMMDGFRGDFLNIQKLGVSPDAVKLNMSTSEGNLMDLFRQAREMQITLIADRIESMEQMKELRRSGCTQGQGRILYEPMCESEYRKKTGTNKKKKKDKN